MKYNNFRTTKQRASVEKIMNFIVYTTKISANHPQIDQQKNKDLHSYRGLKHGPFL